jgi:hypothetical protein
MKRINIFLLILVALLLVLNANAQQPDNNPWCPSGAQWVYEGTSMSSGLFYVFEYEKDTTFNNKTVKKINKKIVSYWFSGPNGEMSRNEFSNGFDLMYNSNDSVYLYVNNAFKLLYYFSPSVGDSIPVDTAWAKCSVPSYPVKQNLVVDSIYPAVYDGVTFTIIRYKYDTLQYYYHGPIIKNIGSYNDVLPLPTYECGNQGGQVINDYTSSSKLICYSDNIRGEINFHSAPTNINCHMIKTGIHSINESIDKLFVLYPNPVSENLNVEHILGKTFSYKVLNINGKTVLTGSSLNNFQKINVRELPAGIYVLLLQTGKTSIYTYKFVKQ